MKIAILSRNARLYSTRRLVEAARERGHTVRVLDPLRCYMRIAPGAFEMHCGGKLLRGFDAVIPRIGASITFYGTAVVRQFEKMGAYTPNDSDAILRARDKLRALQLLAAEGLDLPTTVFGDNPEDTADLLTMLGEPPHVIKLNEGAQGQGVLLAEKRSAAQGMIEAFRGLYANFLVQEFIREAKGADLRCFVIEATEGVQKAAMRRGIDQSAVVVLAVDLHQRRAELLHHLNADRLVVDEGAGAAIGELDAAQDQRVFIGDIVGLENGAGGMARTDFEDGRHLPLLGALAYQRLVAAAAQRQREGIQQDRLAGAGLAGQHGEVRGEIDVEPVDQDDVADRKTGEHGRTLGAVTASACCRFVLIIKDGDGGHKANGVTVNRSFPDVTQWRSGWISGPRLRRPGIIGNQPRPTFLKARLIQEPVFSLGSSPPLFTRA